MAHNSTISTRITGFWPLPDVIYITLLIPIVLAALLEWFLWLAAFLYCLQKVYQKADHWSIKVLAVVMMILFAAFRGVFLPIMIVTLPLPKRISQYFPKSLVFFLQWVAFWMFAVLLIVPWLFCVYRLVTSSLGRAKRIKEVLDERSAPKTVVVMPVYKEEPHVLMKAIDSVVDCDYPPSCIHVFLSYDGGDVDEDFLVVVKHLGIPATLKTFPQSIDASYKGARITVSRFRHGGKRHCQKLTFRLIDKIYAGYLRRHDNLFLLFIDSDCILDTVCLQNFMYDMELRPGSKRNKLAMTGVITSTTEKNSLITLLQDMEYLHGQLFERSVESGCGAVTCLPGALTILRFSAFRRMAKYYFADKAEQCEDLFDYGKCHLGEDRWLTHLFMIGAKERYQIGMCTSAFCKTEAVQTFKSLLKQRRRWFLGFITNEVCMLTDVRLWRKYPVLCMMRFMQNTIRTTALLFFIMVISLLTTSNRIQNLPVGFIAMSLGLNYMLMLYFGAKLRRYKAWFYPLMFLLNPFFNWLYMVYGIFTAGQRTWGGPRADAARADDYTTAEQAVEQAKAQGDELNVDVGTFRVGQVSHEPVPVQPSDSIEGRFSTVCDRSDSSSTRRCNSETTTVALLPQSPYQHKPPLPLRDSLESVLTEGSQSTPILIPRRLDSLLTEDDRRNVRLSRLTEEPLPSLSASGDHAEASGTILPPSLEHSHNARSALLSKMNRTGQEGPTLLSIPAVESLVRTSGSPCPGQVMEPLKPLQPACIPLTRSNLHQYESPEKPPEYRATDRELTPTEIEEGQNPRQKKPKKKRLRLLRLG